MNNILLRVFSICSAISCASTYSSLGQTDESVRRDRLDEVQVTGSRSPMSLSLAPRIVSVIDRKTVESLPVGNITDLLKTVAGVDVRQRGALGVQSDVSIRGGTFDQIAVLLDGISVCDPQTGHNVFDFPVDISQIERIEILEGPAGKAMGASSLLGTINIVTRKEDRHGGSVRLEGGSFGMVGGGAGFQYAGKRLYSSISGNYLRSDGHSRNKAGGLNADMQSGKLFYRGRYSSDEVTLKWHFGFLDKDYGANTFYGTASDDQFEHVRKYNVAFQGETKGKIYQFRPVVYWNRSEDRFEFFRGRPDLSPFNYHLSDVFGISLNNSVITVIGKTSFGAEYRNEGIVSTALGEDLQFPRPVADADAEYTRGMNRSNISFYLEHSLCYRFLSLSAGVVAVKNTGNEMKFRYYPGIDLSFTLPEGWKIYTSFNTSLRMPTFTELYYSVGGHKADRNLKPEEVMAAEFGLKYGGKGLSGSLSAYYSHGSKMIDWIKDLSQGEDAPWQSVNHTVIHTAGVSPSFSVDFPALLDRDFFIRSLRLSYNYIWQDKKTGKGIQSKYALEYLRHKVVGLIDFKIWNRLFLSLSCRWQERVGNYQKDGVMTPYRPYTLVDAKLSWEDKAFRLFLEGNNILDCRYYDHGNIPQPGIWVRAGGEYRFSFGNKRK